MVEDAGDDIDLVRFVIGKYEADKKAPISIILLAYIPIKQHRLLFIIYHQQKHKSEFDKVFLSNSLR